MIRKRFFEIKEKKFEEEKMITKRVLNLMKFNYKKPISTQSNNTKIEKLNENLINLNEMKNKKIYLLYFLNWIFTKKKYNLMNNSFNKILLVKKHNQELKTKLSFLKKFIENLQKKKKNLSFFILKKNSFEKEKDQKLSLFFSKNKTQVNQILKLKKNILKEFQLFFDLFKKGIIDWNEGIDIIFQKFQNIPNKLYIIAKKNPIFFRVVLFTVFLNKIVEDNKKYFFDQILTMKTKRNIMDNKNLFNNKKYKRMLIKKYSSENLFKKKNSIIKLNLLLKKFQTSSLKRNFSILKRIKYKKLQKKKKEKKKKIIYAKIQILKYPRKIVGNSEYYQTLIQNPKVKKSKLIRFFKKFKFLI